MRAREFIVERIDINWIRPWILRSAPGPIPEDRHVDWYATFFKKLKADKEFKAWAKKNVVGPITLKPRLKDIQDEPLAVLDAEHITYEGPSHEILITVNVAPTVKLDRFVDALSARMAHEMAHAEQVSGQFKKADDQEQVWDRGHSLFRGEPPAPKNETEKYYQYILNKLEQDAWVVNVAMDIKNVLGAESAKYLPAILKQAENDDHVVVKSRIIAVPGLNAMLRAAKHYRGQLIYTHDQMMRKLQKELYGYLTR